MFGYPIKFNFDGHGMTHQTYCGAVFTVFYIFIIFAFFAYCCNKMVNRLQDTDNLIISSINLEKIGFMPFEKTKFKLFA